MFLGFRLNPKPEPVALRALQAWWAVHPPTRGKRLAFTRPYVHSGFMRSWASNGLNTRVVERVRQLLQDAQSEGRAVKLYVTGAGTAWTSQHACMTTCGSNVSFTQLVQCPWSCMC